MNKKANELGLTNTHFTTPHGLDDEEHYTTAYELAKLTDYALKNELFSTIVNTKTTTIVINSYSKSINNTNNLLGYVNGVNGVKTGFTNGAGRCIVLSVNRNDWNLIFVVLGCNTSNDRTKDSIKFIDYCYDNYELIDLLEKISNDNKEVKIKINKGKKEEYYARLEADSLIMPVLKNNIDKITFEKMYKNEFLAPVNLGEEVGSLSIKIDENQVSNIKYILDEDINKKDWKDYYYEMLIRIPQYLEKNL